MMITSTRCDSIPKHSAQKMKKLVQGILLLLPITIGLLAQSSGGLVTYGTPYPHVTISPGQLTTLAVTGAPTVLPVNNSSGIGLVEASTLPLPTSLAGFAAVINQEPNKYSASLPIVRVSQMTICPLRTPACLLTLLTVQIPSDVVLSPFPTGPGQATSITVSDDGSAIFSIFVSLDPVTVHILTACDFVILGFSANSGKPTQRSPCNPLITHADGTLVGPFSGSSTKPAQPGETLVMYALGLGVTQPAVPAGTASPALAAAALRHFSLVFNYNCGTIQTGTPSFVGLTPGQVGLFQVNFKVPEAVACTTFSPVPGGSSGGNLTLLSDDWISSDTVLLYVGANTGGSATAEEPIHLHRSAPGGLTPFIPQTVLPSVSI